MLFHQNQQNELILIVTAFYMINYEYLFPETLIQNPFSFVGCGIQICSDPVLINGYKLIVFFSRLDNPNYPYFVAPVESKDNNTYFFKFKFISKIPDFREIGLKTKIFNTSQIIIYLDPDFEELSDSDDKIVIESGNWKDEFNIYNKFAILKHIDVIPNVYESMLRNQNLLSTSIQYFHKLYGVDMNLNDLYKETKNLLNFLNFNVDDSNTCLFGCLKTPINNFIVKCFPNIIFGEFYLTTMVFKQLLSFQKFIMLGLHKLKYSCNEDLTSIINALNQYQKDNNLKIGNCSSETLNSIFRNILLKSNDPLKTLNDVCVSTQFSVRSKNTKLGELEVSRYENYQSYPIITQLSNLISNLDSPTNLVASYQNQFIDTFKSLLIPLKSINETTNFIETKINRTNQKSNKINNNINHSYEDTESIIQSINQVNNTSNEINSKIDKLSKKIKSETKLTKILLILFLLIIFIYIIQTLKLRYKMSFMNIVFKPIKVDKNVISNTAICLKK